MLRCVCDARGQNQTTLLPVRRFVDKQDPLSHDPTGACPIDDWANQEVVYGVDEDIAVGLSSMEDGSVITLELETHNIAIAPVGL